MLRDFTTMPLFRKLRGVGAFLLPRFGHVGIFYPVMLFSTIFEASNSLTFLECLYFAKATGFLRF